MGMLNAYMDSTVEYTKMGLNFHMCFFVIGLCRFWIFFLISIIQQQLFTTKLIYKFILYISKFITFILYKYRFGLFDLDKKTSISTIIFYNF